MENPLKYHGWDISENIFDMNWWQFMWDSIPFDKIHLGVLSQ